MFAHWQILFFQISDQTDYSLALPYLRVLLAKRFADCSLKAHKGEIMKIKKYQMDLIEPDVDNARLVRADFWKKISPLIGANKFFPPVSDAFDQIIFSIPSFAEIYAGQKIIRYLLKMPINKIKQKAVCFLYCIGRWSWLCAHQSCLISPEIRVFPERSLPDVI